MNKCTNGLAVLCLLIIGLMFAGCSSGGGEGSGITLVSISVTPTNSSIAAQTTQPFTATGTFSDNTTRDLTTLVGWSSSAKAKATIDANGKATAIAAGITTIMATLGTISGSTNLTVTNAALVSIAVTPANSNVAVGTTRQFTAIGMFSDNTTQDLTTLVAWSSSDTSKATIVSNGKASAVTVGTTTIKATFGIVSDSTFLTVTTATLSSIAVIPAIQNIAAGTTQQFTASGTFSDNTTQDLTTSVAWSSSASAFATISNAAGTNGKVTGIAAGVTTITATSGLVSSPATLTVTSATLQSITVTPTTPSISVNPVGTTQQFTATGHYSDGNSQNLTTSVTWTSADTSRASISNAAGSNGIASTVTAGTTIISATSGTTSGTAILTVTSATLNSITVKPSDLSNFPVGSSLLYTATGNYADNTQQDLTALVTWSSLLTSVATMSNNAGSKGLANVIAAGTTRISATAPGGTHGSTSLEAEVFN